MVNRIEIQEYRKYNEKIKHLIDGSGKRKYTGN